jgi:hypothetical protein
MADVRNGNWINARVGTILLSSKHHSEKETAMSATATATLRNTAANSVLRASLLGRLLSSAKETLAALAEAISELVTPATSGASDVRTLYRLSRDGDSVNPQVLEALQKTQALA